MNYELMMYKTIGERIKRFRLSLPDGQKTQQDFCSGVYIENPLDKKRPPIHPLDTGSLSRIENGKVRPQSNPHLLNEKQIEAISKKMKLSSSELIWGDSDEKECLAKLFIISTITNEAKSNPFIAFKTKIDFFNWANKQLSPDEELYLYSLCAVQALEEVPSATGATKVSYDSDSCQPISINELHERLEALFVERYGIFFNRRHALLYELAHSENDSTDGLIGVSNRLLERLMNSLDFTVSYANRLDNYLSNTNFGEPMEAAKRVEELLLYKGEYADIALDYCEYDYFLFVKAFDEFWKQRGNEIMTYFEDTIFDKDRLEESGLKAFKNTDIENALKSMKFINLISGTSPIDQYVDSDAMLSRNYITLTLQKVIHKQYLFKDSSDLKHEEIWEYLSDILIKTRECIKTRTDRNT